MQYYRFIIFTLGFLLTSCSTNTYTQASNNKPIEEAKMDNFFSYYKKDNNVQFTALNEGKLVINNNCLYLDDGLSLTTPVFNVEKGIFDLSSKKLYLNEDYIPLNESLLLGGGYLNKEYLPKLDSVADEKCLTDRVFVLNSVIEDSPELRKRWLLPE